MNYFLFVTGCQQNFYDGEKITHLLESMGYLLSDEKNADVIIAIACSVKQKPVDKIFTKLKTWNKLTRKPKIIIVGCVLPHDKKKLQSQVNIFIKSNDLEKNLTEFLENNIELSKTIANTNRSKLVPIMFGCDNFCTYCAVPYTRERETSRNENEIINEIKNNIAFGIDEVMLLGQNVNSFKPDFIKLLNKIEKIDGLNKVSFMTSHPKDMSDNLIKWMSVSSKFSLELHLPVQSGDNKILQKMNRHYTCEYFIALVNKIKKNVKLKYFSTDIIVGFPGESEKQFENTIALCKKINFNKAFISQYSPRIGTPSAKLADDVSQIEKKRRWKVLDNLINKHPS